MTQLPRTAEQGTVWTHSVLIVLFFISSMGQRRKTEDRLSVNFPGEFSGINSVSAAEGEASLSLHFLWELLKLQHKSGMLFLVFASLNFNSTYGSQVEVCAAICGQHADLPRAFSLVLLYRMFPPTYRGQKPRKKDWLTVLGRFLLPFMYDSIVLCR